MRKFFIYPQILPHATSAPPLAPLSRARLAVKGQALDRSPSRPRARARVLRSAPEEVELYEPSPTRRMGIDIYARWRDMTPREEAAQITGFSAVHGHVGYLREAYHGEPYATRFLVPEAFAAGADGAPIPAAVLRVRLDETLVVAEERERKLYRSTDKEIRAVLKSYRDFVALCEAHEARTGEPCRIIASC